MEVLQASIEVLQASMEVAKASPKVVKVARMCGRPTRSSALLLFPWEFEVLPWKLPWSSELLSSKLPTYDTHGSLRLFAVEVCGM